MRVLLGFDGRLLAERERAGGPLVIDVEVEHEGVSYPFRGWSDFGAVIVGWWTMRTVELLQGAAAVDFDFMDGPYSIRVARSDSPGVFDMRPEGKDYLWNVSSEELVEELVRAAGTIRDEFGRLGVGEIDRMSLEVGIARLRDAAGR